MLSREVLDKLVELAISNKGTITIADLKAFGIDQYLKAFLYSQRIIFKQSGIYQFVDALSVKRYANNMRRKALYELSNQAFDFYLTLNPMDISVAIALFAAYSRDCQYEDAYRIFQYLKDNKENPIGRNSNFYEFIFSKIVSVPEEVTVRVKNFTLEDMFDYGITNKEQVSNMLEIRTAFFQNAFFKARLLTKSRVITRGAQASLEDQLIDQFAFRLSENQNDEIKQIYDDIMDEDYEKIIAYYEDLDHKTSLSIIQKVILFLAQTLQKIQKSEPLDYKASFHNKNLYNAILKGEFYNALNIMKMRKMDKQDFSRNPNNIIYILLSRVCLKLDNLFLKENSAYQEVSESYFKRLYNGEALVICDGQDPKLVEFIFHASKTHPDIIASSIPGKFVVLRKNTAFKDIQGSTEESLKKADHAFMASDYDLAFNCYMQVILSDQVLSLNAIVGLAFCSLRKNDIENAIDYFSLASSICECRHLINPYQNIVNSLKTGSYIGQMQSIWSVEKNHYNMVYQLDDIIALMQNEGLSLEDAADFYNLSCKEKCRLFLFFAQNAFDNGDISYANELYESLLGLDKDRYYEKEIERLAKLLNIEARS